jgi:hypothetical protein
MSVIMTYLPYVLVGMLCLIVALIVLSYGLVVFFQTTVEDSTLFFNQFNKQAHHILAKYGDCVVRTVYLVRQPFTKTVSFCLNLLTGYQYQQQIEQSAHGFPYHSLIVCEVTLSNGQCKWVVLEKNSCIYLSDTVCTHPSQEMMRLRIAPEKQCTLSKLLQRTRHRMGDEAFFNWRLYTNNCKAFTKEILQTLGENNSRTRHFLFRDRKVLKAFVPSDFTIHIIHCACVVYNILIKYVYDHLSEVC